MHVPHAAETKFQDPKQKPQNWIINALERNVESHPDWPVYRYLDADGNVTETITCKGALQAAHSVAAYLRQDCKLLPGDRVALVYPPGAALSMPPACVLCSMHVRHMPAVCSACLSSLSILRALHTSTPVGTLHAKSLTCTSILRSCLQVNHVSSARAWRPPTRTSRLWFWRLTAHMMNDLCAPEPCLQLCMRAVPGSRCQRCA